MDRANQSLVTGFFLLGFSELNVHLQHSLLVLLLCIFIVTVAGNMLIIVLVSMDERLQTPMYIFLRNLSFLEVCFISTTVPNSLQDFFSCDYRISFMACASQMFLFVSMGVTECLFLAIMAYDRHVAICKPLHYVVIMSPRLCFALIAVSWLWGSLVSSGLTGFIFSLPYCGSNSIRHFFCDMPAVLSLACADTFMNEVTVFVAALVGGICPFMLILFSYIKILLTVLRMNCASGRVRAFSTCGSHLFSVILFYGSTMGTYLRIGPSRSQEHDKLLSLLYSVATPMLNPLIYTLRNQDVKDGFKRLVRRTGFLPIKPLPFHHASL